MYYKQSWGCEALALLSWPGGAGGREGRGYCHEADVLEEELRPKQYIFYLMFISPASFVFIGIVFKDFG